MGFNVFTEASRQAVGLFRPRSAVVVEWSDLIRMAGDTVATYKAHIWCPCLVGLVELTTDPE